MRVEDLAGRVLPDTNALMMRENIPVILTENAADFAGIKGITPINPFA